MGVVANPLLRLLPRLRIPSAAEIPDTQRDHDALVSTAQGLHFLIGAEFHEETIRSTGTVIPHGLKRKPFGRIILWQDDSEIVFDNISDWNDQTIKMTATKTVRVMFALLSILVGVLPACVS